MFQHEDVIFFTVSKAYQRLYGIYRTRLQRFGLTPSQALVLHALYEGEGVSAGELGQILLFDNATLSGILNRMVEGGWITKDVSDEDRRTLKIHLTPKAMRIRTEFLRFNEELNTEMLSRFRVEERLLLRRMLLDIGA